VCYASDGGKGELLERIGRRDEVEVTVPSVSNLKGIGDDELGAVASPPPGTLPKRR